MNVSEYIEWSLFESGRTITEFDLGEIFKLDPESFKSLEDFNNEVLKRQEMPEYNLSGGTFMVGDKEWVYDDDLTKTSIGQWSKMHQFLSESQQYIDVRLVALYIRPKGEEFNIHKLDEIAKEIYDFPIEIFLALNNFFFQNAQRLLKYMKISYLNQANQIVRKTKKKGNHQKYGRLTLGILYLKGLPRVIISLLRNSKKKI